MARFTIIPIRPTLITSMAAWPFPTPRCGISPREKKSPSITMAIPRTVRRWVSRWFELIFCHLERGANGAQDRFMACQLEVIHLPHDEQGALARVKTANPAGVGQIEAKKADVIAHGG